MQHLLANYLFTNKICALPKVGTLQIVNSSAEAIIGEQMIAAPKYEIVFTECNEQTPTSINQDNAVLTMLTNVSTAILSLPNNEKMTINSVGSFSKSDKGIIIYESKGSNTFYFPFVKAERVIHPNQSHTMLVGENETSTTAMAEYYAEDEVVKKSKWWIWAAVILLASAIVIIYQNFTNHSYGNNNSIENVKEEILYKKF